MMNKNINICGYNVLLLVLLWDTLNYNISGRVNTCYDYWTYLSGQNYTYIFTILILISLYLMLVKLRIKITIETSFE